MEKEVITINTDTEELINKIKTMQNTNSSAQNQTPSPQNQGEDVFIGEDVKIDFVLDQDLTKYLASIILGEKATPEQVKQLKQKAAETVFLTDQFVAIMEAEDSPEARQKIQGLVGQVKLGTIKPQDTAQNFTTQAKAFTGLFQEILIYSDPEIPLKTYANQFALFMEEIDPKLYLSVLNYSILYNYEQVSPDPEPTNLSYDLSPDTLNPEEFIGLFYPEDFTSQYIEETIKTLSVLPEDEKPDYLIYILQNIPSHLLQSTKTEEE